MTLTKTSWTEKSHTQLKVFNFGSEIFGPKDFRLQRHFGPKEILGSKKCLGPKKILDPKKFWVQKNLDFKNFGSFLVFHTPSLTRLVLT